MMYGFSNIGPIKCTTDTIEYILQFVQINGIAIIIIPTIVMLNNIYMSANTLNAILLSVLISNSLSVFYHLEYQ